MPADPAPQRLQHTPTRLATFGAVAQNLLRSESVASSRIEDVLVSHKRLARVAHLSADARRRDSRAEAVLGNVEAMRRAIEIGVESPIGVEELLGIHRLLLGATPDRAIAHVQIETIHPFADGNGRAGRALIYAVLRRRGEVAKYISPISLLLAADQDTYIAGLHAYRRGEASAWCKLFAEVTGSAAREAERLAEEIESQAQEWLERAGHPRRDSAARLLIAALPEQPVLSSADAQRLTGRSHVSANKALEQLESAGILRRLNQRKWGRVWECDELLDLVEDFERTVATRADLRRGAAHIRSGDVALPEPEELEALRAVRRPLHTKDS